MDPGLPPSTRRDPTRGDGDPGDAAAWAPVWLGALVAFFGVVATLVYWQVALQTARADAAREFDHRVETVKTAIQQRILTYEEALAGAVGLFDASVAVTRAEFRSYSAAVGLRRGVPGIQAVVWAPWVPAGQRASHTETFRAEGVEGYTPWPESGDDPLVPVAFIEPFEGLNVNALGYDLWTDPVRRAVLERARDQGAAALSGRVRLVNQLDPAADASYMLCAPVYRGGGIPASVDARREALTGWVYAPFHVADFMADLAPQASRGLDIELFDDDDPDSPERVFDRDGTPRDHEAPPTRQRRTERLDVAGHTWVLLVQALPPFDAEVAESSPRYGLAVGLIVTTLLSLLVWELAGSRARAYALARVLAEEAAQSEERYRKIFAGSRVPLLLIDPPDGRIVGANPAGEEFYGYTPAALRTMRITDINTLSADEVLLEMERARSQARNHFEFRHRLASGEIRDVEVSSGPIELDGETLLLSVVLDVTERKQLERDLRALAATDALTGVANRRAFMAQLETELARLRRDPAHKASLLMLDLDHFKRVNDRWGHAVGDQVLVSFAEHARAELRASDMVARVGGEEFAVLLVNTDAQSAHVFAERLRSRLVATPAFHAGEPVVVTASVGITVLRPDDTSGEITLARADAALYRAKGRGRDRIEEG